MPLRHHQSNHVRVQEPRLGKKLIEPLTELIHGTPATSLLYECIKTVLAGIPDHTATIQLCVQKLRIFVEDSDQNLKYLGLQAMSSVLKIAPKAVHPHRLTRRKGGGRRCGGGGREEGEKKKQGRWGREQWASVKKEEKKTHTDAHRRTQTHMQPDAHTHTHARALLSPPLRWPCVDRDLIIACLDDDDESIRLRALDLLAGMVNKKTLIDIVRKLLLHLEGTEGQMYRDEVVAKIIAMCSQNTYQVLLLLLLLEFAGFWGQKQRLKQMCFLCQLTRKTEPSPSLLLSFSPSLLPSFPLLLSFPPPPPLAGAVCHQL